jgi:Uma2 family endonuclease
VLLPQAAPHRRDITVRLLDYDIEIPPIHSLAEFQEWAESDSFPQRGRIDYIAGSIEVDMSPEDLYCHGTLTSEIHLVVASRVKQTRRGQTFFKQTRLYSPAGDLSAEPDILYVSFDSLRSGRVILRPRKSDAERFIAFEGAADLAIEVVSNSSVAKDTRRLPQLFYRANVAEFWMAVGRHENLIFHIFHRGRSQFERVPMDAEGYQQSAVLDGRYRLDRYRDEVGQWAYELKEKPAAEASP